MKSLIGDFSYFSSCFQPLHFKYKLWKCHCSHNVLVLQAWLEGSSQDVFCILCSLVQTSSFVLVWFLWFFFWIPIFEQFDQGNCFVTVMFETCPTSGIYKFLITISVVSPAHDCQLSDTLPHKFCGLFLKLEKKLAHFLHVFPSFLSHQECVLYASSAPWHAPAIKSDIFQHRYHIHL